jgi:PPOX class probable F420-dependent enzyme
VGLDEQVRAFLDERRFGVLATVNADGSPQQTVMWYALRGDRIMMNTARGRTKDRNMLRDRRVSLCVEDGFRFVTIQGDVEMIDDQTVAQADIRALAERYEGPDYPEEQARANWGHQQRITLILSIRRVISHGFDDEP